MRRLNDLIVIQGFLFVARCVSDPMKHKQQQHGISSPHFFSQKANHAGFLLLHSAGRKVQLLCDLAQAKTIFNVQTEQMLQFVGEVLHRIIEHF